MNRKSWMIILLLCSLLLLLGGVHRPQHTESDSADPVVSGATSLVAHTPRDSRAEWLNAARTNPLWILQIEAAE
jgi:hypothetical protein